MKPLGSCSFWTVGPGRSPELRLDDAVLEQSLLGIVVCLLWSYEEFLVRWWQLSGGEGAWPAIQLLTWGKFSFSFISYHCHFLASKNSKIRKI